LQPSQREREIKTSPLPYEKGISEYFFIEVQFILLKWLIVRGDHKLWRYWICCMAH